MVFGTDDPQIPKEARQVGNPHINRQVADQERGVDRLSLDIERRLDHGDHHGHPFRQLRRVIQHDHPALDVPSVNHGMNLGLSIGDPPAIPGGC